MGVVSTSGRWQTPAPSSLLGLLLSNHVYLDTWHPLQVNPRCAITCPRYANAADANTSLVTQRQGGRPFHRPWGHGRSLPFTAMSLPHAQDGSDVHFSSRLDACHLLGLMSPVCGFAASLTELERQAAQYVCAPSIVVPGAYKAASSTLFANIAKHPQVLRVRRRTRGRRRVPRPP